MEIKRWKIVMVALLVFAAPLVAFASPAQLYPTPVDRPVYQNYDWPYMLAFKGIAVNGEDTSPAALIALGEKSVEDIKQLHFILDGEAFTVEVRGIDADPEKGIVVIHIDGGQIIAKTYTINYQQTVFVSGNYKDWELNMVLVNMMNDYNVFYKTVANNYPEPIPTAVRD